MTQALTNAAKRPLVALLGLILAAGAWAAHFEPHIASVYSEGDTVSC